MRTELLFAGIVAAAGLSVAFFAPARETPAIAPVEASAPAELGAVPDFELIDEAGRPVRRSDLRGPWIASFFFARCRDVCPIIAKRLARLHARLPEARLVSLSVDPADGPVDLARFKASQGADWSFLTGRGDQVRRLSRDAFKLAAAGGGDAEPVTHSSHLALVDAEGRIRGYYDSGDDEALARLESDWRGLAGIARRVEPPAAASASR